MTLNNHYITIENNLFNNKSMKYPKIPFLLQNPADVTNRCGKHCDLIVKPTPNVSIALRERYISVNCSEKTPTDCADGKVCSCEHVFHNGYAPGYWAQIILINKDQYFAHPI